MNLRSDGLSVLLTDRFVGKFLWHISSFMFIIVLQEIVVWSECETGIYMFVCSIIIVIIGKKKHIIEHPMWSLKSLQQYIQSSLIYWWCTKNMQYKLLCLRSHMFTSLISARFDCIVTSHQNRKLMQPNKQTLEEHCASHIICNLFLCWWHHWQSSSQSSPVCLSPQRMQLVWV